MFFDGRLVCIDVFGCFWVWVFVGGGIGISKVELQKLYGVIKVELYFYDDIGFYFILFLKDGCYGICFEIEDGCVSSYYVGFVEVIQYVEGCE